MLVVMENGVAVDYQRLIKQPKKSNQVGQYMLRRAYRIKCFPDSTIGY